MQVESKLIKIPRNGILTSENIENELKKQNIKPLRWAVVDVSDTMYTVSVADIK